MLIRVRNIVGNVGHFLRTERGHDKIHCPRGIAPRATLECLKLPRQIHTALRGEPRKLIMTRKVRSVAAGTIQLGGNGDAARKVNRVWSRIDRGSRPLSRKVVTELSSLGFGQRSSQWRHIRIGARPAGERTNLCGQIRCRLTSQAWVELVNGVSIEAMAKDANISEPRERTPSRGVLVGEEVHRPFKSVIATQVRNIFNGSDRCQQKYCDGDELTPTADADPPLY